MLYIGESHDTVIQKITDTLTIWADREAVHWRRDDYMSQFVRGYLCGWYDAGLIDDDIDELFDYYIEMSRPDDRLYDPE